MGAQSLKGKNIKSYIVKQKHILNITANPFIMLFCFFIGAENPISNFSYPAVWPLKLL